MRNLLRHGIDVAIERRQRLTVGVVRVVGRGDGSDGSQPAGTCSVQIVGEAAGGYRGVVSAMLPTWSSGIIGNIREGDYVAILLGSTAGELAMVVWRYPAPPEHEPDALPSELVEQDHPAQRSSHSKSEGTP